LLAANVRKSPLAMASATFSRWGVDAHLGARVREIAQELDAHELAA